MSKTDKTKGAPAPEQRKKVRRLSPIISVTMPPLTLLEARRQADSQGMSLSRWLSTMVERYSARNSP